MYKHIKKLSAIIMVAALLIVSALPCVSAAEVLKTNQTVSFGLDCSKPGYTFELFEVAKLTSTSATPYETKYTSLVPEISSSVLAGNTKNALTVLDKLSAMPTTAKSKGTFVSSATSTTKTFDGLEQGIYYVRCTAYPADVTKVENSLLALPYYNNGWVYTYPNINLASKVVDKTPHTVKEITNSTKSNVNFTDVSLGDTVNFKLTNTTTGSSSIKLTTYTVSDDMSAGLTLDKNSFNVYLADIDGNNVANLTAKTDYNVNVTKEKDGENTQFNVALTNTYLAKADFYSTSVVSLVVEYSAMLNKYAVTGATGNPNTDVELTYGNTSGVDSVPGNTVYVYTYGINIEKLDENGNHLQGATFELYKNTTDANAKKNAIATGVSDSNGAVKFMNSNNEEIKLQSGKYFAVETIAPTGYNVYGKVITIDIDVTYQTTFGNNTWVQSAPEKGFASCSVTDTKVTLPQTGGYVQYYYFFGSALIVLSGAIFFISKKRKKEAKNK